jgi:hypothetical protein
MCADSTMVVFQMRVFQIILVGEAVAGFSRTSSRAAALPYAPGRVASHETPWGW